MRIFYAADATPNAAIDSKIWRNNLYLALIDLGHKVIEFEYDLRETFRRLDPAVPWHKDFIARNRPRVSAELLRQVRAAHRRMPIDLLFTYFYDSCILPETIEEIRGMGIRTVNWYCNGSYQLHLVSEISPHYDWCLVPERFRLKDYVTMGARPIYCQEAANPNLYRPYDLPLEFDVTFVGQAYGERPAYIKHLLDSGIDVRVWGPRWLDLGRGSGHRLRNGLREAQRVLSPRSLADFGLLLAQVRRLTRQSSAQHTPPSTALPPRVIGGILSDTDMIRMYSRSRINLGFSSVGDTHISGDRIVQVRLRDFEVPMSGGFYMVEYMEELEEFFNVGREIACYTGPDDLTDKISYYLRHESEREAIRRAGRERCLRDHTWQKRLSSAFRQMGLAV